VSAVECDLHRVLADEGHILDAKLFRAQSLDSREPPRRAGLTATFSARTGPAQLFSGVLAVVAVLPRDFHDLACTIDVDVDWKRIRILQLLSA
jgi:hypothetical protein